MKSPSIMQSITLAAESVQSSILRIRSEIMEPYDAIREKTTHYTNLQSAVELLRHMLQSIKLTQRLRAHIGAGTTGQSKHSRTFFQTSALQHSSPKGLYDWSTKITGQSGIRVLDCRTALKSRCHTLVVPNHATSFGVCGSTEVQQCWLEYLLWKA